MEVTDVAVYIACIAFVITQVHLALTARKLLKRNDRSWAQARSTIFESSKVIHDDVVKQISESGKNAPLGDVKTTIAELESRVNALPGVIEDRMLKIQGGLRESFVLFGDQVAKSIEAAMPKFTPRIPFNGDPKGAQAAGQDTKNINKIISTLEVGAGTGGNLLGAVNDLASMLETFGEPNLADWLQENPDKLPQIYARVSRNPRLAQGLARIEQKISGQGPPGNGGLRSQGGYDLR
jgi:hypothetical protein